MTEESKEPTFREIIAKLSEPLTKEDIELRVGTNSAKSFTLLLYKTARVDKARLNRVCPLWSNRHYVDSNGSVVCVISIWDYATKQWVSREDVGAKTDIEKEKGPYSDSVKRAGFNWGIGSETYNAPTIRIMWDMKESEYQGKKKYTPINFWPNNLEVSNYEVTNGKPQIEIKYNGKVIFPAQKGKKPPSKPVTIAKLNQKENPGDPIWKMLATAWSMIGNEKGAKLMEDNGLSEPILQCSDAQTLYTLINSAIDKEDDINL